MVAVAAPPLTPHQVLKSVFGYDDFRPGQLQVIETVLEGRDCIAVMPTGAGKSLTYQIPAQILPGTGLVISPLIALMKDQVDNLTRFGFKATYLNSTLSWEEKKARLQAIRAGMFDLVYVAPEAIEGSLRSFLSGCRVNLVAVDEAHCISQWGHDFRPAYRRLRDLKSQLGDIPILALTATATNNVARDIIRQLGMVKPGGFKGSFFRPNLHIYTVKKGEGDSRKQILALVKQRRGASGIIYCLSRKSVESLADFLKRSGIRARGYHAGMKDEERAAAQDAFARDDVDVIVATIAFGMGIDKSNVRYVIHRDMPGGIEAYYQEIGRAGRDGLPSDCILFYSWADVIARERFQDGLDPELAQLRMQQVKDLYRLADTPVCRHRQLVSYFHQSIEPCAESCDVCLGRSLNDLMLAHRPVAQQADGGVSESGAELFDRLRALRRKLADAEGVPAYIIFSDDVLLRIARERPRDEAEMLGISGVGPAKLARYGADFLDEMWPGRTRRPVPEMAQALLPAVCPHESKSYVVEDDEDFVSAQCRQCNEIVEAHLPRCPAMLKNGERRCGARVATELGLAGCRSHASSVFMAGRAAEMTSGASANVTPIVPAPEVSPTPAVRPPFVGDSRSLAPAPAAGGGCTHGTKVYRLTGDPDVLTLACRECGRALYTDVPRCRQDGEDGRCPRPVLGGMHSREELCGPHARLR